MKRWITWVVMLSVFAVLLGLFATVMPGKSHTGKPSELESDQRVIARDLERHVERLALDIGPRSAVESGALADAAAYLKKTLERLDFQVESTEFTPGEPTVVTSLKNGRRFKEVVLVVAHYDSRPGSPGANDNASGCAVALELARVFRTRGGDRELRFVFCTQARGAEQYAADLEQRSERIKSVVCLASLGRFVDTSSSQRMPFVLTRSYPERGDFLAFVGDFSSRDMVRDALERFRKSTKLPSEGLCVPGFVPSSDFQTYEAFSSRWNTLLVTDTGRWRDAKCGTPADRLEALDFERMALVVTGLVASIEGQYRRQLTTL